ncbi:MAG: hypothetical protein AB7K71_12525 [Polyangiaceae bacterium]
MKETCPVCGIPGLSKGDLRILTQVGPGELAWLGPGGSLYPVVGEELSNSVALKLQQPGWLSASEASAELGVGLTAPAAIQLSADGTEVTERLYTINDRVVDQAELTALRGVGGDGIVVRSAILDPDAALPPPRSGFLAAYSRARAMIAVVGGVEDGGMESKDVWMQDVRALGLSLPRTSTPGRVSPVSARIFLVEALNPTLAPKGVVPIKPTVLDVIN